MLYKSIALSFFFCLAALAQNVTNFYVGQPVWFGEAVTTVPSVGGWTDTYYPTNIPGYPALGWWVAADYTTNSGKGTIPNRSPNVWPLTNTAATGGLFGGLSANGFPLVLFNGTSSSLLSTAITSTCPFEIAFYLNATNTGNGARIFSTRNGGTYIEGQLTTTPNFQLFGLLGVITVTPITNQFIELDFIYNGSNSFIYVNGTQAATGTTGTNTTQGNFGIGYRQYAGDSFTKMALAEICMYGNGGALPGTNTTTRTLLYNYFTSKYPTVPNTNYFQIEVTTISNAQPFTVALSTPSLFTIQWGDSSTNTYISALSPTNVTHTYATTGIYTVQMQGAASSINFAQTPSLVTRIKSTMRGITGVTTLDNLFSECASITSSIPANLFDDQIGCASFRSTFNDCRLLAGPIPNDLFKSNSAATTFNGVFSGSTNLWGAVPVDLFRYNTNVTDFGMAFYGNVAYSFCMTSFPTNLFQYNPLVTTFYGVFYKNRGFSNAIPADLFRYNTNVVNMSYAFANCSVTGSVPEGLFQYNTKVTDFSYVLHAMYNIGGSIPTNLFKYNPAVTNFAQALNSPGFTNSIPAGLFDQNTNNTSFAGTFSNAGITNIPAGLFDHTTNVTTFNGAFSHCISLKSIPNLLFDKDVLVTDYSTCFYNIILLTGATPQNSLGQELWQVTGSPTGTQCFYNDTSMSNYGTINSGWK